MTRLLKLVFLLLAAAVHSTKVLVVQAQCTKEADTYNNCLERNLWLCDGGCQQGGPAINFVVEQQLTSEDVVCGLLKGSFCIVHHCCQRVCTREIQQYFGCLSRDMTRCGELLCLGDVSSSVNGVSMHIIMWFVVLLGAAYPYYY